MEKAYSYRFYPTPEQESLLRRTLGCVRLVYNKALHLRTQAWYERQERVGYTETSSMLTDWKKQEELEFLNEVSCVHLQLGLVGKMYYKIHSPGEGVERTTKTQRTQRLIDPL